MEISEDNGSAFSSFFNNTIPSSAICNASFLDASYVSSLIPTLPLNTLFTTEYSILQNPFIATITAKSNATGDCTLTKFFNGFFNLKEINAKITAIIVNTPAIIKGTLHAFNASVTSVTVNFKVPPNAKS